jgi:peptide/nickel transport system substrate-binding protein
MKKIGSIFAIVLLLLIIGCSKDTAQTTDNQKTGTASTANNTLRIALSASPPTLDAHVSSAAATNQVSSHIFEYLVAVDKDYKVSPVLAEKIEVSPDGKTYTFPLRKGVKFHNGKTLVSEDVVASLQRWQQISMLGKSDLVGATITAKDENTVQINLKQPSSAILAALANVQQGAVIMPKEVIAGADAKGVKEYIGTGPFQFVEWKQDQFIHLKKFADYKPLSEPTSGWAGKREAKVDDLYFMPVPDAATRVAGLQSGDYDIADEIPFDNYDLLKNDPNLNIVITKPRRYNGLVFNAKTGVFANVKMRQAVNTALDLDSIMMAATGNKDFYRLTPSIMNPEQPWYVESGKENFNQKNPEKAKQLLKEAGYNGEPITILGTRDYDFLYKSSLIVKDQLEKIGMKVNLEIYDWPTLVSKRSDDKLWNIFFTFYPIFPNPTQTAWIDSRHQYPGWYKNPQMDQLLDQIKLSNNFDEQKKIFEQAQALYMQDVPIVKLGDMYGLIGMRKNVKDFNFFLELNVWNVSKQ